jgi:hypothetical protein
MRGDPDRCPYDRGSADDVRSAFGRQSPGRGGDALPLINLEKRDVRLLPWAALSGTNPNHDRDARAQRPGRWSVEPQVRDRATTCLRNLAPNQIYTICGAAWAGETDVTEIAVSTDGGQTWADAEFLDPVRRHAWRRWKFDWLTPNKPGQYTLLARAKDAAGRSQPDKHDQNNGVYVINHCLPIEVFVCDSEVP